MQALRFGERYGYVGRNVAQLVDLPPAPRREGRSLAIEQSERLLSAARGERLEAAIVTGLMLGLRPGELLGLTRTDYSPRRATRHNGMVGIEGHVTHGLGIALGARNDGTGRWPTGHFRRSTTVWWWRTEPDETGKFPSCRDVCRDM